jgi:hypothetical protein
MLSEWIRKLQITEHVPPSVQFINSFKVPNHDAAVKYGGFFILKKFLYMFDFNFKKS